jgi:deoxyribodipyrimidine photo-lyase
MNTTIWWIRRDLRLTDNQTLAAAMAQASQVVPIFIFDPNLVASAYASSNRLAFLLGGLRQLAADLGTRGSYLVFRPGDPLEQLTRLMQESNAGAIFAEEDFSPYARRRDAQIARMLPLRLVAGVTVHSPRAVQKADGSPYAIFTPYSKAWKALPQPAQPDLLPAPAHIPTPAGLSSETIPTQPTLPPTIPFPPGETEAQRRLSCFSGSTASTLAEIESTEPNQAGSTAIFAYAEERNRLDLEGTSKLSPYLRFGMLSARQAVVHALAAVAQAPTPAAAKGAETWLNELIWREFYISILHHFPAVRGRSFRPEYDKIQWRNDENDFAAWCAGRTGYPVVDAAMRQLLESGWMHNRARMLVASFLVKDLLIDWRWGERWFMQHLVDGDPAANNGGWQWTAGVGTDAAPYFRVFNPVLQSQKFDPGGAYIRRWLPELAQVPDHYLHTPWDMPTAIQHQAGCRIGQDYPSPLVNHNQARERTLAAYAQARE